MILDNIGIDIRLYSYRYQTIYEQKLDYISKDIRQYMYRYQPIYVQILDNIGIDIRQYRYRYQTMQTQILYGQIIDNTLIGQPINKQKRKGTEVYSILV